MADISNAALRKQIISEITSDENKSRKEEALQDFEIYKGRQRDLLINRHRKEFGAETTEESRIISSINLARRIVDETASIYKSAPERTFATESGRDLSETEVQLLENIYQMARANVRLKSANRKYKLHGQCCLQVIPKDGALQIKVLQPHHYDVVPDPRDPERAMAYVLNVYDKSQALSGTSSMYALNDPPNSTGRNRANSFSDGSNQNIGDPDDYKSMANRLIWWSDEYHFVTDESGVLIPEESPDDLRNPIGRLPFVDIACDKDMEFFVRDGSTDTDFSMDISLLVTDYVNVAKMQGHAVSIIFSEEPPANMTIGPNRVLHIPLDPTKEVQPSFQFASPNPDLSAHKEMIESIINLYLTSKAVDPKAISGNADARQFASGLERLLAMIEKFEASRDDIDLFSAVEDKVLELFVAWSNFMQDVTGPMELHPRLRMGQLPEDTFVDVSFAKPEVIQTKSEREDSAIKMIEAGLMSRVEALADIREIDEDSARDLLEKIDEDEQPKAPTAMPMPSDPDDFEEVGIGQV